MSGVTHAATPATGAESETGVPGSPPAQRKPFVRSLLSGVALAAILAVTWLVVHTAPTDDQWQAAMPVTGQVGDTLAGRNIEATVHDVRIADSVTASTGWAGETTGIWVVVDASAAAVVDDTGALLNVAELQVGDVVYGASTRPGLGTIANQSLSVGIDLTGPLMFEIPRELLSTDAAGSATLRFALDGDTRLDSTLEVPVDLASLDTADSIETDKPVWGNE
jgi:hypothetical protein